MTFSKRSPIIKKINKRCRILRLRHPEYGWNNKKERKEKSNVCNSY